MVVERMNLTQNSIMWQRTTELFGVKESMCNTNEIFLFHKHGLPLICTTRRNKIPNLSKCSKYIRSLSWLVKAAVMLSSCNEELCDEERMDEDGIEKAALLYKNNSVKEAAFSIIMLLIPDNRSFNSPDVKSGLNQLLKGIENDEPSIEDG